MNAPLKTIHIVGPANAGKSWLRTVVFERRLPLELILEKRDTKLSVTKLRSTDFVQLDIYDWPDDAGEMQLKDKVDAVVYVIDAQEDLKRGTIQEISAVFQKAKSLNPNVTLQVFVHKVDGDTFASEELRVEVQQAFQEQITQEMDKDDVSIHLTSVYNPSLYEAWSLVVQKLIPNQSTIVELLDALVEACKMEKAFLFDTKTRLYLATDHNPVDHQTLTLCADSIDLAIGFDSVYGTASQSSFDKNDGSINTRIRLSNNMVLYAQQAAKSLALVCVARRESWTEPLLIERNVCLFKEALKEVRNVREEEEERLSLST